MPDKGLVRPAALVGSLTLSSRILGMVRDIIFAAVFGASQTWDIFVVAYAVPNLFRKLFGEGALTSAFLPAFVSRLETENKAEAGRLIRAVLGWMILVLGALVVAGMVGTWIAQHYVPGNEKLQLTMQTLRITLPYALLICMTAVLSAALNGLRHFALPAFTPLVLNVGLIVAALISLKMEDATGRVILLAWGMVLFGVVQLGIQVPPLARAGVNPAPAWKWRGTGLKEVLKAFLPVVAGLAIIQVNEILDVVIAEICVVGDGAVSALYYANRLHQLPLGVIGVSIATVAFTTLASHAARGDREGFSESLRKSLGLVLFVSLPAAIGLAMLAPEITRALFERGAFEPASTRRTSLVAAFYAGGIPFYTMNMVLTRGFYSQRDMMTPLKVSLITVGLNLLMNLSLVWGFQEAGIAFATSVTGVLNFVLLLSAMRQRSSIQVARALQIAGRILIVAGVMGLALYGGRQLWPAPEGLGPLVLWLCVFVGGGCGLYFSAAWLVRLTQVGEIVSIFRRR